MRKDKEELRSENTLLQNENDGMRDLMSDDSKTISDLVKDVNFCHQNINSLTTMCDSLHNNR
eukprot:UN26124